MTWIFTVGTVARECGQTGFDGLNLDMLILFKVNWVDQTGGLEPHQCVRYIGGISRQVRWKHTQAQAIDAIERGLLGYYMEKDGRAWTLDVEKTPDGKKYLTIPNSEGQIHLLLDLPGFPDSRPVLSTAD